MAKKGMKKIVPAITRDQYYQWQLNDQRRRPMAKPTPERRAVEAIAYLSGPQWA